MTPGSPLDLTRHPNIEPRRGRRKARRSTIGTASLLLLVAVIALPVIAQGAGKELCEAARAGDLAGVKAEIAAGTAIDSGDRWGVTALAMAVGAGHEDVVRFLLEKGADPNSRETFYGRTVLIHALQKGHFDLAILLLQNGSEEREAALGFALRSGAVALAQAAVESGPVYESTLVELHDSSDELTPELRAVLAKAERRPDPPPPQLDAEQLQAYAGNFEGWDSDARASVVVEEGKLVVTPEGGSRRVVKPVAENTFRAEGGDFEVAFFGRTGAIEGIVLPGDGDEQQVLRRSVAEPVTQRPKADPAAKAPEAGLAESVRTVHWPAFRGPAHRGIGDGDALLADWDLASGDGVLWQAELEGLGNSSPVVWGDTVYLTTAVAKDTDQELRTGDTGDASSVDEAVEHRWLVMAFDKWSGALRWQREIGRAVPKTQRHFKASQASSTPATDGKYLVVVFPTAGLACLDLEGKVLWKVDLGGLNASSFYDPSVQWGFASSPLIHGEKVILQVDVYGDAYIAAWDLKTGRELWRTPREVAPSWATPSIARGAKGDELVVNGSTIHGYDPETGRSLWSLAPNSELVIATPIIDGDIAYVSAGYPPVKPIYAIPLGLRGELEVEPGTPSDKLRWSHARGGAYMPTPLLYRGRLFVVHHNGRMVIYDAASGDPILKRRFSRGGIFTASPLAANGKLYAPTEEGMLYVLEAEGVDFRELAVHEFDEPLMATPAISEGLLLVRTPKRLLAIGKGRTDEEASR